LPQDGQQGGQPGKPGKNQGQNQGQGQGQPDPNGQGNNPDPGGCGEVREMPGPDGGKASKADLEKAEAEWKQAAVMAANMAKKQGKLPAGIDRLVQDIIQPKVPVAELLARFVAEITKNDFSWMVPNRRYVSQGLFLPSLHKPEVGEVILLVDTSGSISQNDLNLVAGVMQNILGIYQKGFTLVYVDAAVAGIQEIGPDDNLKLEAKGGGGTDFRPGFEWIEKEGREPKAVIYITDGYCNSFPEVEPPFPVMWLLNMKNESFKAPWGETHTINWLE
jgi:predicted metal-dependent peptidase